MTAEEKLTEIIRRINPDHDYGDTHDRVYSVLHYCFDYNVARRYILQAMNELIKDKDEEIERLKKVIEWISVKDRLPEVEEGFWKLKLLVTDGKEVWQDSFYKAQSGNNFWLIDRDAGNITHWLPLPQPPTNT